MLFLLCRASFLFRVSECMMQSYSFKCIFGCACESALLCALGRFLVSVHSSSSSSHVFFDSFFGFAFFCRAMDLLVPYILEGRSELRNHSRVNCKTHSVFGLQNTLLTERIKHLIDRLGWWVCLAESILGLITYIFHVLSLFCLSFNRHSNGCHVETFWSKHDFHTRVLQGNLGPLVA